MVQLITDYYDFARTQYPAIARALKEHSKIKTTKDNDRLSWLTNTNFTEVVAKIPDNPPNNYEFVEFKLDWDHARAYAYSIGLTDVTYITDDEEEQFRYNLPLSMGTTRQHHISIYGKELNKCGDHPFQVRIIGDMNFDIPELPLLQSWHQAFEECGRDRDAFVDKIIGVGKSANHVSEQGDAFLASIPKTEEDFQERIRQAKERNDNIMVQAAIGMARFFHDFIELPIKSVLGDFNSLVFQGTSDFSLSISPEDVAEISKRPTEALEKVVRKIFPKHHDDVSLSK